MESISALCCEGRRVQSLSLIHILKEYLRRENARAEDAVFIGDTVYDMDCAADAGVDGALALWGLSLIHI